MKTPPQKVNTRGVDSARIASLGYHLIRGRENYKVLPLAYADRG